MRFYISDPQRQKNVPFYLRQVGYRQEVKRSGVVSYIRSVSGSDFPRFHIYVDETSDGWSVNLHLDQKEPSYQGTSAHGGEYEGKLVEEEMGRLKQVFSN